MHKTIYTSQYRLMLAMLKDVRVKAGFTQTDVAEKLQIAQSDVSKCELGLRRLDVIELRLWLEILGKRFADFLHEFEARLSVDGVPTPRKIGGSRRRRRA